MKNTKAAYFMKTLNNCENNPKEMWKTINKLTNNKNSKTTLTSEIQQGNQVLTTKHEIAEALNAHFGDVGPELARCISHGNRTPESYVNRFQTSSFLCKMFLKLMFTNYFPQLKIQVSRTRWNSG